MCLHRNLDGQSRLQDACNIAPENTPMTSVLSFPTVPEPHHFAPKPKQIPPRWPCCHVSLIKSAVVSLINCFHTRHAFSYTTSSLTSFRASYTLLLDILSSSTTNDKLLPSLALHRSTTTPSPTSNKLNQTSLSTSVIPALEFTRKQKLTFCSSLALC